MAAAAPTACRMDSLPVHDYAPPNRSRTRWRHLWRALWRRFRHDPRLPALGRAERRKMQDALLALHAVRDYATGLIDAHQGRIAAAGAMGVTRFKEAVRLLWEHGYVEVVPRRRYDAEARPEGWRGRGKWLPWTNAYEPKLPADPPRFPSLAPEAVDEDLAPGPEPKVEEPPTTHSGAGIRPASPEVAESFLHADRKESPRGYPQAVDSGENRAAAVERLLLREQEAKRLNHWTKGRYALE